MELGQVVRRIYTYIGFAVNEQKNFNEKLNLGLLEEVIENMGNHIRGKKWTSRRATNLRLCSIEVELGKNFECVPLSEAWSIPLVMQDRPAPGESRHK